MVWYLGGLGIILLLVAIYDSPNAVTPSFGIFRLWVVSAICWNRLVWNYGNTSLRTVLRSVLSPGTSGSGFNLEAGK